MTGTLMGELMETAEVWARHREAALITYSLLNKRRLCSGVSCRISLSAGPHMHCYETPQSTDVWASSTAVTWRQSFMNTTAWCEYRKESSLKQASFYWKPEKYVGELKPNYALKSIRTLTSQNFENSKLWIKVNYSY